MSGARPASPTEVRIDGRRPSEFPGAYAQTRATYYPGTPWPCAMRIGREAPWLVEEWTARIKDASDALKSKPVVLAGKCKWEIGSRTEKGKVIVSAGLKDQNGCTLRILSGPQGNLTPMLTLLKEGQKAFEQKMEFG